MSTALVQLYDKSSYHRGAVLQISEVHQSLQQWHGETAGKVLQLVENARDWLAPFDEVRVAYRQRDKARLIYDHYMSKLDSLKTAVAKKKARNVTYVESSKEAERITRNERKLATATENFRAESNKCLETIYAAMESRYHNLIGTEVELYKKAAGALATLRPAPDQLTQATRSRDQDGATDFYEDKRGTIDSQASKSVRQHAPAVMEKQYEFSSGEEEDSGGFQSKPSPPTRDSQAKTFTPKPPVNQKPYFDSGFEGKGSEWSSTEDKTDPWQEYDAPGTWGKQQEKPTPWREEEKAPAWGLYPELKPEKPVAKEYGFPGKRLDPPVPPPESVYKTKQPPAAEFGFSESSDDSDDFEPKPKAQDWHSAALPPQRDTPGFAAPKAQVPSMPATQQIAPPERDPYSQSPYSQTPHSSSFSVPPVQPVPSQPASFPYPPNPAQAAPGQPPYPANMQPADYQAMLQMMQKQMFDYQNMLAQQTDPNDPFRDVDSGAGVIQAVPKPQRNPFTTAPPGMGNKGGPGFGDLL